MERFIAFVEALLSSPILWGVVALVAIAIALSGRLSVSAATFVLWISWAAAVFGIFRAEATIKNDPAMKYLILIVASSSLAIGALMLQRWFVKKPESNSVTSTQTNSTQTNSEEKSPSMSLPAPKQQPEPSPSQKPTARGPQFVADVPTAFLNSGQFWAVYRSQDGDTVAPVDAMLEIRIVNTQDKLITLNSLVVEMKTAHGWLPLRTIPLAGITPYAGPINKAGMIQFSLGDIRDAFGSSAEIAPGATVRGIGLFEYSDPSYLHPGGPTAFRITLEDTAHRRTVREAPAPPKTTGDPFAQFEWLGITGLSDPIDLRKFKLKRFSARSR